MYHYTAIVGNSAAFIKNNFPKSVTAVMRYTERTVHVRQDTNSLHFNSPKSSVFAHLKKVKSTAALDFFPLWSYTSWNTPPYTGSYLQY